MKGTLLGRGLRSPIPFLGRKVVSTAAISLNCTDQMSGQVQKHFF